MVHQSFDPEWRRAGTPSDLCHNWVQSLALASACLAQENTAYEKAALPVIDSASMQSLKLDISLHAVADVGSQAGHACLGACDGQVHDLSH